MQESEFCGKLILDQKGAIECPNCHRRIKKIRLRPGGELHDAELRCSECRFTFTANISGTCAEFHGLRR